jgi:hypothetical protein
MEPSPGRLLWAKVRRVEGGLQAQLRFHKCSHNLFPSYRICSPFYRALLTNAPFYNSTPDGRGTFRYITVLIQAVRGSLGILFFNCLCLLGRYCESVGGPRPSTAASWELPRLLEPLPEAPSPGSSHRCLERDLCLYR